MQARRQLLNPDGGALDRRTEPLIRIEGVAKAFGAAVAVDGVSLEIGRGEFFCLLGPSGCGKSTLLRLLAGFEEPDRGRILLDGRDLAGVPPHRRPLNMMFQSYALFPHLTVAGNVAYGLKQERLPRREIALRVEEMLRLVQLDGLGARYPAQISGGQRQRAALARALAKRPRVLLLDEPLGALDRRLREETQGELKALQAELGTTFVMVTHDQAEAMALADRIAVMREGRILQSGPPREIYERPASRFVAAFLGDINLFEGEVVSCEGGLCRVATRSAEEPLAVAVDPARALTPGDAVAVAVRPENLLLRDAPDALADGVPANRLSCMLHDATYQGGSTTYRLALPCGTIARLTRRNVADEPAPVATPGARVQVGFSRGAALVLDR